MKKRTFLYRTKSETARMINRRTILENEGSILFKEDIELISFLRQIFQ
jgi:hypothetical protein